jgi:hypothetical protein
VTVTWDDLLTVSDAGAGSIVDDYGPMETEDVEPASYRYDPRVAGPIGEAPGTVMGYPSHGGYGGRVGGRTGAAPAGMLPPSMLDGLFDKFKTGDFSTAEAIATVLGSGLAGFGLAKAGGALPTAGLLSGLTGGYQQGRQRQAAEVNATLDEQARLRDYQLRQASAEEARKRYRNQVLEQTAKTLAGLDDPSDYLRTMSPVLRDLGIEPGDLVPRGNGSRAIQRAAGKAWTLFTQNAPKDIDLNNLQALDAQFTLTVRMPGGQAMQMKPSEVFASATGMVPGDDQTALQLPRKPKEVSSDLGQYVADEIADKELQLGRKLTPGERAEVRRSAWKDRTQATTRVTVHGGAGGGVNEPMSEDGIDYAATVYRMTNTMPPLGMGPEAARARRQIINRAAAQSKAMGRTPAATVQKAAAFKADSGALTQMRKMSSAAEAFEYKALEQIKIIEELSPKTWRSSRPILNEAINRWNAEWIGDPQIRLLANAVLTFTSEYSKIINGATGSAAGATDSARHEAAELLSQNFNEDQLRGALALMKREMQLTMQGYEVTIGHIEQRQLEYGGSIAAPGASANPRDPMGIR